MDTLIQIQSTEETASLGLLKAAILSVFITATTVLGISLGKHAEKTVTHMEVPNINNVVYISRREEES